MGRHVLIAGALGAVLMGVGVVVGTGMKDDPAPYAPPAQPALLEVEAPDDVAESSGPALSVDELRSILGRLDRLERAIDKLRAQQERLGGQMKPAGDLLAFFQSMQPQISRARLRANETAAHATLRNLISAQAQIQASGRIDTDADGVGEYGGFREMSGASVGRMSRVLVPPVLSGAFKVLNRGGEVMRSGYYYKIYLPDGRGGGIAEGQSGFNRGSGVHADLSETTWCMYAWPADASKGKRTFFTNQGGDVLVTQDERYVGEGNGPAADAAFTAPRTITGMSALGRKGNDGNVWQQGGS